MTKFRNTVNNLLTEKDTYLSTPKTFSDKEMAWYKGGINPNALFDANAIWYGMPKQINHTDKVAPDWNSKFIVKNIKYDHDKPYATLQEIREYLNNDNQWQRENVGEQVYIPTDALLKIIKSQKNILLYDQIMQKDKTRPHEENPDKWHNNIALSNLEDDISLSKFYEEHMEDFDLRNIQEADFIKHYYDDGYSAAYIKAFLLPYLHSYRNKNPQDMSYNPKDVYAKIQNIKNLKNEKDKLEKQFNTSTNDSGQLNLNLYGQNQSPSQELLTKIQDVDAKIKKAENEVAPNEILKDLENYEKDSDLRKCLWKIEDYEDEIKKYGIK